MRYFISYVIFVLGVIFIKELYLVLMKNRLGNVKVCRTLIKKGLITVNNNIIKDCKYKVNYDDIIVYQGKRLNAQPFIYYMMNKPKGYICANKDSKEKCVIDLIDKKECYCLGRLDKDTTGLLILTNDKSLAKKLLLPQNHIKKKYLVKTKNVLKDKIVAYFKTGVVIDNKIKCLSSDLEIIDDYHCYVTISEGKYHQIKKMFLSCDNQVVELKRIEFAQIKLDDILDQGEYRCLTDEELKLLL